MSGRATVMRASGVGIDVATASGGRFGPSVAELYQQWSGFRQWVDSGGTAGAEEFAVDESRLGLVAPQPEQVFAIGLNYLDHAAESGMEAERDVVPPTFTKFVSSLAGPFTPLPLPSGAVDWEIELVAIIGEPADAVSVADAWSHVAGVCVGQDYSERTVQSAGPVPQFSLGKSYAGFGPIGPWLVTPDELPDRDDLELVCEINGEQVQKGRTSAMVWSLPELVSVLSAICPLRPGDVIFTGTPAGVGAARNPKRFLSPGDVVVSRIEGVGEIRQECRAAVPA
ncbi:fumarylacetoacetate hydrolase family protein [Pseudonocardia xishanensis]|uniref:fumarylacetoacetate hydrolase family protein n=1 Tax=Pseudonocardia xishanensis TaxID=630995 RepID=UPI0031E8AA59